jgi:predicted phage terminase large subunit-like protein
MLVHDGEIKRLHVSMSPRAGKSYITSLFCAWALGMNPTESVMRNTCTARLYQKFSYDVRNIIRNQEFKDVFPNIELSSDNQSLNGWNLEESRQVGYFGAGVGGTIIGFGATLLAITDDMYKSLEDALSENQNEKVLSWAEGTHGSRLEKGCPQIDIGTRWHKNDLIGRNQSKELYDLSIVIPALNEEGESFCEDVKTTDEYKAIRSEIDSTIWDAEYMQEPVEAKGLMFPESELRYYKPDKLLKFEGAIAYADIADEGDDHLSAPIGQNIGKDVYITDLLFNKENTDITIPLLAQKLNNLDVKYIRVESNNMGGMYAKELRKVANAKVLTIHSKANKHTRILMDAAFIRKHCLFVHPDFQTSEYKAFMKELCGYLKAGGSRHDDAPDSLSGLARFIQGLLKHLYK